MLQSAMNTLLFTNSFTLFKSTKLEFELYFYAIAIVSGIVLCGVLAVPLLKKKGFKADIILDMLLAIIPCSIIFARLGYVLFELDEFTNHGSFLNNLVAVANIRSGGMSIYGGVAGGALGLFIVSKVQKVSMGKLSDIGASLLPLGQAIGRLGNFFNQEVYGKVATSAWWPYSIFIEETGKYHLALCFYEMFLNLILFAVLFTLLYKYNGKRNLYVMGLYFIGYGTIRALLEPLRMPEFQLMFFNTGLKAMVLVSIALIIVGLSVIGGLLYKDIKEKNYWWKTMFCKAQSENVNADGAVVQAVDSENSEIVKVSEEEPTQLELDGAKIAPKTENSESKTIAEENKNASVN